MINKERTLAKGYDTPNRCSAVTSTVYSGPADDRRQKYREAMDHEKDFYPEKSQYNIYIGDIHGHSRISTGIRISTKGNKMKRRAVLSALLMFPSPTAIETYSYAPPICEL